RRVGKGGGSVAALARWMPRPAHHSAHGGHVGASAGTIATPWPPLPTLRARGSMKTTEHRQSCMTPHAIAVEKLVKIYKRGVAVDGVSFRLPAGSVTGLLRGNGAGKTTTIPTLL